MNARERFRAICRFERPNDPFMLRATSWNETLDRWVREGMPVTNLDNMKQVHMLLLGYQDQSERVGPHAAISATVRNGNPPYCVAIDPRFELKVLKEDDERVIQQDLDGTIVERRKQSDTTIPRYLEYPVKDRQTWEEYRKRLDPFSSGRWPQGWDIMTEDKLTFPIKPGQDGKSWEHRDFALGMSVLSLYGNARNYMGLENISMALYDDPKLVEDMVEHQAYLGYEMVSKVFEAGITLDWVWIWEDMCYKAGPLVSPSFVRKVMAPRYRRVVDLLRSHGVEAIILDSDGNVDDLLPIWVDCGINAFYPFEGAAGMDARQVRRKFGKDVIIVGSVDKRALARGKAEIDAELDKCRELLKHGGFFPSVDHHIPPDIPYRNIVYFLNELRKMSDYPETRRQIPLPG